MRLQPMSNLCEFQPQVPITETVAPLRSDTLQGNDDGVGGPETLEARVSANYKLHK